LKNYGFNKIQNNVNYEIYNFADIYKIIFNKKDQSIEIKCLGDTVLSVLKLKAINEKVKELGWEE